MVTEVSCEYISVGRRARDEICAGRVLTGESLMCGLSTEVVSAMCLGGDSTSR